MRGDDAAFYSGKTVLVTGHTGFKGSWLSRWLTLMGSRVVGLSLEPEQQPNLFELAKLAEGMTSVIGDICDVGTLRRVIEDHRPEIVFHMAAQSLVRRSYREPVLTYETNVMGTVNLLEACRSAPSVRSVVVVTSDKCYENNEWPWGYREIDPLGGADPYSSSKACAEIVTAAYRRSFFSAQGSAGVASVRAGNVIGGGDWAEDRIVPDIVRGAKLGSEVVIRNPASTRPWQHVLEPLSGYLLVARRLHEQPSNHAEAWNFGPNPDDWLSVGELAKRFVAALGRGRLSLSVPQPGAPHEARLLALDCSKARTRLGWRPRLDFDSALRLTADWYRTHLESPGAERASLDRQIEEYSGKGP